MLVHRFECRLGFIFIARQKQQDLLIIIEFLIKLNFVFGHILMELLELAGFILVVLDMAIKIEARSSFLKLSLFFLP